MTFAVDDFLIDGIQALQNPWLKYLDPKSYNVAKSTFIGHIP